MAKSFSGYQVLAYCLMGNHFHVLLAAPPRVAQVGEVVLPYDFESELVVARNGSGAGADFWAEWVSDAQLERTNEVAEAAVFELVVSDP